MGKKMNKIVDSFKEGCRNFLEPLNFLHDIATENKDKAEIKELRIILAAICKSNGGEINVYDKYQTRFREEKPIFTWKYDKKNARKILRLLNDE